MRYYGFRSELGRAHGKNLKIHVIFRTEYRLRKGVTCLESACQDLQNGAHFNNFWKGRCNSSLRESYVKYTIVKYSKNKGDKFIKKIWKKK